jgi:hypothetical protein
VLYNPVEEPTSMTTPTKNTKVHQVKRKDYLTVAQSVTRNNLRLAQELSEITPGFFRYTYGCTEISTTQIHVV